MNENDLFYLYGILLGVLCDDVVAPEEVEFLRRWRAARFGEGNDDASRSILAKVDAFLRQSEPTFLSAFEIWREVERTIGGDETKRARTNVAIWYLRGFLRGLLSDATIAPKEWRRLGYWLKTHSALLGQDANFDAIFTEVQAIADAKNKGDASDAELTTRFVETLETRLA